MAKLMKPLFYDGRYNSEGKRIRAEYVKTIGEYPLWVGAGEPDKEYGVRADNDKYYLYIEHNGWLVPTGITEFEIAERAGYKYMLKEWYSGFDKRTEYFNTNFYDGKEYAEYRHLVNAHVEKENAFIAEVGKTEEVQFGFLKASIDGATTAFAEAKNDSSKFPDFIGALFVGELELCQELAEKYRMKRGEEEGKRRREAEKEKALKLEEEKQKEQMLIKEAENIFMNGGTIKGGEIIVLLADKYNVNIPIRTRGWILSTLAETTITVDNGVGYNYRYWKTKNGRGSQKVYDIFRNIRETITATA